MIEIKYSVINKLRIYLTSQFPVINLSNIYNLHSYYKSIYCNYYNCNLINKIKVIENIQP